MPAGYVASQQPIEVRLLLDGTTDGADASRGRPVSNSGPGQDPPIRLPDLPDVLPWTGFVGATLLLLAALLGTLGALFIRHSRRRHRP